MILDPEIATGIILFAGGITAGLFSGLLGIGGGIVLVPVQYNLLSNIFLVDPDTALRSAFATSLAVTLPTAVSSAFAHNKKGMIVWRIGILTGISGFFGGLSGGFISSTISSGVIIPFFIVLMFSMALMMLFFKTESELRSYRTGSFPYIFSGFLVGIVSGMFGIGGGIIIAPVLILFCRMPSRIASATTSLFVIAASTGGIISYMLLGGHILDFPFYTIGYLNVNWWLVLVLITVPMAQAGVWLLHKVDPKYVRYLFAVLLLYLSGEMLGIL